MLTSMGFEKGVALIQCLIPLVILYSCPLRAVVSGP